MLRYLFCSVFLLGCADVAKWSTAPGESYCGVVTSASFVRAGIDQGASLRLELDAERLQSSPGRLWTTPFQTGERFDGAELRPVPQMLHDPLATLTFGEGRVKSAIVIGDLRSADGRSTSEVFVVVSLMQSGDTEVRIVRGASAGSAPVGSARPAQIFGVFALKRQTGNCGVK